MSKGAAEIVHQADVDTSADTAAILALVTAIDAVTALLPNAGALLVPAVDSVANVVWGDPGGNKSDAASSAAGASTIALLRQILLSIGGNGNSHLPLFGGAIWYTDAAQPDDTGDGKSPETAKKTITAGEALMSAGDALNIKAGTYTENVTLSNAAAELWGEIGAIIVGTLTMSADSCRARGLIVAPAAAVGLALTGNRCEIDSVSVVGTPTTAFDIDGYQNILTDIRATGYTVTGYDVANYNTHIKNAIAQGSGGATRGYYFSNAAADDCTLENCKSAKNATSSFYFVAGAEGTTIDGQCSSGAGDGRWVDTDEAQIWNDNFHFADYLEKVNTLSVVGADTVEYNLFKVTGSVMLKSIVGVVETALTGTNTDTYLDLFSVNGSVLLTENTPGEDLGALIVGSVIAKVDESDEQLAVGSASGPSAIEEVDARGEAVRVVEDRTGAAHVATYVRFIHTCAAGGTGEIHWYISWEPVSDDGWLETV